MLGRDRVDRRCASATGPSTDTLENMNDTRRQESVEHLPMQERRSHPTRSNVGLPTLKRWSLAVAVIGTIALCCAASVASATQPAGRSAAEACAGHHSLGADLNESDYGLLQRYVPCVLLNLLGKPRTVITLSWNRLLAKVMTGFERDPRRDYTTSFIGAELRQAAHPVLRRILPRRFKDCAKLSMEQGDTVPPPITLANVALAIGREVALIPPNAAWETWGVYVGHRPLFHDGPQDNISWAVSGVAGAVGC
jgi:hypothetical protein